METATLAGGCFWCTEAIFKRLKGVTEAISGYAGGKTENPTIDQVYSGKSGHAESIQITFDPKVISFDKILEVFWHLIDPTTLNRQAYDIGTQYRSVIFYHTEEQRKIAEKSIHKHQARFNNQIVTQLSPFNTFYKAAGYHKNYYDKNRSAPYCRVVIDPKIQKLYKEFKNEIKSQD